MAPLWPFGSTKKISRNDGSLPCGAVQLGDTLSSGAALVSRDARAALVKDLNQCVQAPKCPITDHTPAGRRWLCGLVPVACPIGAPVGPAGDPCPPLCAETSARPLLCTSLDRCCCRACLHLRHFWHHHRIGLRNRRFQVRILVPAFWCAPGSSRGGASVLKQARCLRRRHSTTHCGVASFLLLVLEPACEPWARAPFGIGCVGEY